MSAFDKQISGNHYKSLKIQPMQYALENNLNYGQANAIKYITRYKSKNGLEDLKKAIHCIELLIDHEYNPGLPESGPILTENQRILIPHGVKVQPIVNPHLKGSNND